MDEVPRPRLSEVSTALRTINTVLSEIISGMAAKTQLDATMARMNDGFERMLKS